MNAQQIAWEAYQHQGACQRYSELAAAVELVEQLDPHSLIAEIGVDSGGTLYCWRQLGAEVFAITLPVPGPQYVKPHGAQLYWGDSHSDDAWNWLTDQLDGRLLDVLFIDGDHTYEGCRDDFDDYSGLVRPGGLVLMHDVLHRELLPAVGDVWDELVIEFPGQCWVMPSGEAEPAGFGVITIKG